MADMTVTAANVSGDWNQGTVIRNFVAGGTVNVGDAVYIATDGFVYQADANVLVANAKGRGIVVNSDDLYGSTVISATRSCSVALFGPVYGFSGMTPGTTGWVSATAGKIADAAPTGGAFQEPMGYAVSDVIFFVDPDTETPASV